MCGIVGYIGNRECQEILLDGLRRLEYRGYDSAGIAVMQGERVQVRKCAGRIAQLEGLARRNPLSGKMGIGHTRWATHGEPTDLNAHPHQDVKGNIALVHNGIIENHGMLRNYLEKQGCRFVSQTDTEVIAHLIHSLYKGDMLQAIREAMGFLEGSYALAVICESEPDSLYCVRLGSPLVVGMGAGEMFLASDIPAILPHTRDMLFLEDKEIAVLRRDGVRVYDAVGAIRHPSPYHISWDAAAAEKGGYAHFMLKEMMEQPQAVQGTLSAYTGKEGLREMLPGKVERLDFIACGTAYHAGRVGAYYLRQLAGIESAAHIASEYRYCRLFPQTDAGVLAISQSGETADTLAALQKARAMGMQTAALTNTVGSTLDRSVKTTLLTYAGPEIAVASTKAYITQVETLLLLAMDQGRKNGALSGERLGDILNQLGRLPEKMEEVLKKQTPIQHYCDGHMNEKLMFFIGRGVDYALAMEAALKLKEVSYLPCEAYAAGELKHGAIALIEQGTPVFAICTQEELLEKTLSNLRETKARGAETVCICPETMEKRARQEADLVWTVPDSDPLLLPLLIMLPMQLLAYHMAVAKGRDVDKPRNLAKSVTVE
ncbi:MAG: glutamine--fructose-6-phosphate transaminase (isomerizing) [Clostridiales bacterium]|nr:glutamine--fructose-6-phosphate transaminase (isomerizing) [Clostridiales bacterium]